MRHYPFRAICTLIAFNFIDNTPWYCWCLTNWNMWDHITHDVASAYCIHHFKLKDFEPFIFSQGNDLHSYCCTYIYRIEHAYTGTCIIGSFFLELTYLWRLLCTDWHRWDRFSWEIHEHEHACLLQSFTQCDTYELTIQHNKDPSISNCGVVEQHA